MLTFRGELPPPAILLKQNTIVKDGLPKDEHVDDRIALQLLLRQVDLGRVLAVLPTKSDIDRFEAIGRQFPESIHRKVESVHREKYPDVEEWTREKFVVVLGDRNVVVMTPHLCLQALNKRRILLTDFVLVVFVKCHHCHGNDPCARILIEHYHPLTEEEKTKVRLLGFCKEYVAQSRKAQSAEEKLEYLCDKTWELMATFGIDHSERNPWVFRPEQMRYLEQSPWYNKFQDCFGGCTKCETPACAVFATCGAMGVLEAQNRGMLGAECPPCSVVRQNLLKKITEEEVTRSFDPDRVYLPSQLRGALVFLASLFRRWAGEERPGEERRTPRAAAVVVATTVARDALVRVLEGLVDNGVIDVGGGRCLPVWPSVLEAAHEEDVTQSGVTIRALQAEDKAELQSQGPELWILAASEWQHAASADVVVHLKAPGFLEVPLKPKLSVIKHDVVKLPRGKNGEYEPNKYIDRIAKKVEDAQPDPSKNGGVLVVPDTLVRCAGLDAAPTLQRISVSASRDSFTEKQYEGCKDEQFDQAEEEAGRTHQYFWCSQYLPLHMPDRRPQISDVCRKKEEARKGAALRCVARLHHLGYANNDLELSKQVHTTETWGQYGVLALADVKRGASVRVPDLRVQPRGQVVRMMAGDELVYQGRLPRELCGVGWWWQGQRCQWERVDDAEIQAASPAVIDLVRSRFPLGGSPSGAIVGREVVKFLRAVLCFCRTTGAGEEALQGTMASEPFLDWDPEKLTEKCHVEEVAKLVDRLLEHPAMAWMRKEVERKTVQEKIGRVTRQFWALAGEMLNAPHGGVGAMWDMMTFLGFGFQRSPTAADQADGIREDGVKILPNALNAAASHLLAKSTAADDEEEDGRIMELQEIEIHSDRGEEPLLLVYFTEEAWGQIWVYRRPLISGPRIYQTMRLDLGNTSDLVADVAEALSTQNNWEELEWAEKSEGLLVLHHVGEHGKLTRPVSASVREWLGGFQLCSLFNTVPNQTIDAQADPLSFREDQAFLEVEWEETGRLRYTRSTGLGIGKEEKLRPPGLDLCGSETAVDKIAASLSSTTKYSLTHGAWVSPSSGRPLHPVIRGYLLEHKSLLSLLVLSESNLLLRAAAFHVLGSDSRPDEPRRGEQELVRKPREVELKWTQERQAVHVKYEMKPSGFGFFLTETQPGGQASQEVSQRGVVFRRDAGSEQYVPTVAALQNAPACGEMAEHVVKWHSELCLSGGDNVDNAKKLENLMQFQELTLRRPWVPIPTEINPIPTEINPIPTEINHMFDDLLDTSDVMKTFLGKSHGFNKALFVEALTHNSFGDSPEARKNAMTGSYGRLAFLGKRVLGLVVAEAVRAESNERWSNAEQQSVIKALTSTVSCAWMAHESGLKSVTRFRCSGKQHMETALKLWTGFLESCATGSGFEGLCNETTWPKAMECGVPLFLADMFHAVCGALFLNAGGFDICYDSLHQNLIRDMVVQAGRHRAAQWLDPERSFAGRQPRVEVEVRKLTPKDFTKCCEAAGEARRRAAGKEDCCPAKGEAREKGTKCCEQFCRTAAVEWGKSELRALREELAVVTRRPEKPAEEGPDPTPFFFVQQGAKDLLEQRDTCVVDVIVPGKDGGEVRVLRVASTAEDSAYYVAYSRCLAEAEAGRPTLAEGAKEDVLTGAKGQGGRRGDVTARRSAILGLPTEPEREPAPRPPLAEAPGIKAPAKPGVFECRICNVLLNGQSQFDDHNKGEKHKKRLKKASLEAGAVPVGGQPSAQPPSKQAEAQAELYGELRGSVAVQGYESDGSSTAPGWGSQEAVPQRRPKRSSHGSAGDRSETGSQCSAATAVEGGWSPREVHEESAPSAGMDLKMPRHPSGGGPVPPFADDLLGDVPVTRSVPYHARAPDADTAALVARGSMEESPEGLFGLLKNADLDERGWQEVMDIATKKLAELARGRPALTQ